MTATSETKTNTTAALSKFEAEKIVGLSVAGAIHYGEAELPTDLGFDRLVDTGTKRVTELQFGSRIPEDSITAIHFLDTMLAHLHTGEAPDTSRDYGSQEAYLTAARAIAKNALTQAEVAYPALINFRMHFLHIFDASDPRLDPAQPELPFIDESEQAQASLFKVA